MKILRAGSPIKNIAISLAGLTFLCGVFLILIYFVIGGGAGSIKSYRYATTKNNLQTAVMTVIRNSPNIYRDSTRDNSVDTSIESRYKDSNVDLAAGVNYYNDVVNYVTITIKDGQLKDEFTFRYYGDQEYWKSSPSSEIFIVYAYDKDRKGGSDGHGDLSKKMEREFTEVFESQFVAKINKELHLEPNINSD
jgi:hypothetical protein